MYFDFFLVDSVFWPLGLLSIRPFVHQVFYPLGLLSIRSFVHQIFCPLDLLLIRILVNQFYCLLGHVSIRSFLNYIYRYFFHRVLCLLCLLYDNVVTRVAQEKIERRKLLKQIGISISIQKLRTIGISTRKKCAKTTPNCLTKRKILKEILSFFNTKGSRKESKILVVRPPRP